MFGILGLLSLYIFIFVKTAGDIERYKRQLTAWNSRIISTLTFAKVEQPPGADWQNVGIENSSFAVYSAFFFQDSLHQVIVVGSHPHFPPDQLLKCRFYFDAGDKQDDIIVVEADYQLIPGWKEGNSGVIIKCYLPKTTVNQANAINASSRSTSSNSHHNTSSPGSKPTFVSILSGNRIEHWNRLPIQYKAYIGDIESYQYAHNFSVCVPPLSYPHNNHLFHFLEWLEYYKMMGVDHFSFYNLTLQSNNASCVMDHLLDRDPDHGDHSNETGKDGGCQVHNLNWHYPTAAKKGSGFGESSYLIDCHLRHKGSSKYVGIINLNEFITPAADSISNFQQLIKLVMGPESEEMAPFADFWFRKRYVVGGSGIASVQEDTATRCALLKSNPLEHRVCQNLLFIKSTLSRDEEKDENAEGELSGGSLAKFIMIPERVAIAGVHRVNLLETGYKTKWVPQEIAYIRQYEERIKQRNGTKSQPQITRDQVNVKAALVLAKNVATSVQLIIKNCGLKEEDILKPLN